MKTTLRAWLWLESAVTFLSAYLVVVTLFWPDWIEALTGFEPDDHSGSLEWRCVATIFVSGVAGILARIEWRRQRWPQFGARGLLPVRLAQCQITGGSNG